MRVISGNLRGHTLYAPKGQHLRPTSDQVKETLFNMIRADIPGATFLDLFAGTGNVGIEALSRGAAQAVFVEKAPAHIRALKRNLAGCAVESLSTVYCGDANKIVLALQKADWQFDIIFLDPPYRQTKMLCDILDRIVEKNLLAETGLVVVEHAHTFSLPPLLGGRLALVRSKRIGDTVLSFFQLSVHDPVHGQEE